MDLVSVLIAVLIIAVLVWGVYQISPLLPHPIGLVLRVLVIVICCVYLIRLLAPALSGISI